MLKVREIVIANKRPRSLELQPNIFLNSQTHEVEYKDYPCSFEGIIRSYVERFPDIFQAEVYNQWLQDASALRYPLEITYHQAKDIVTEETEEIFC